MAMSDESKYDVPRASTASMHFVIKENPKSLSSAVVVRYGREYFFIKIRYQYSHPRSPGQKNKCIPPKKEEENLAVQYV